ncbi:MAG TPA: hypothetical protein VE989_01555 [Sphingomicrobium sp.]|nr:hypothetical protein [Sphingomicrobium sp.]
MRSSPCHALCPCRGREFKGLDHQLDDSDARTQMLTKIGELLERTIGL